MSSILARPEFPRSSGYDDALVFAGAMGPNPLWLLEWLLRELQLEPGMRVLDLGCGRALTSLYLARELGVRVWAADLWVPPEENWRRIEDAGAADSVCPLRAEAHALPFAAGFFDAVISVDAYHYFGTDELYLQYLARFLVPGGRLGVAVPGLVRELEGQVPRHLAEPQGDAPAFWEPECSSFHSADWWRALWERSGRVDVQCADLMPDGWRHWRDWERAYAQSGHSPFPSVAQALEVDAGRWIGFVRLVAQARADPGENLYQPGLASQSP